MKTYNTIFAKGTLGRDARVSTIGDKKVANFSIATEYSFKTADGSYSNEVTWLNVCAWQSYGMCDFDQLKKGATVHLVGRLRQRKYTDRDGREQVILEILAEDLDIAEKNGAKGSENAQTGKPSYSARNSSTNDDMPF